MSPDLRDATKKVCFFVAGRRAVFAAYTESPCTLQKCQVSRLERRKLSNNFDIIANSPNIFVGKD